MSITFKVYETDHHMRFTGKHFVYAKNVYGMKLMNICLDVLNQNDPCK